MPPVIRYLNTDLDLRSSDELTALAAFFESKQVSPLHLTRGEDGLWYATFETDEPHEEPEPNISAMLVAIEALGEPLRDVWRACAVREFNIGYDCGNEPWAFNQALPPPLLRRMADAEVSLRITLYPPETKSDR